MLVSLELRRYVLGEDRDPREARRINRVGRVVTSSDMELEARAFCGYGGDGLAILDDCARVSFDHSLCTSLRRVNGLLGW